MRIKRFVAPTIREAMIKMKKELGSEAVILKSGKVKKSGVMDFVGKEEYEVLAAIDNNPKPVKTSVRPVQPAILSHLAAGQSSSPAYRGNFDKMQMSLFQSELNDLKQSIAHVGNYLKYKNVPSLPKNLQMVMKQLLDNEVGEELARNLVEGIHNELRSPDFEDLRLIIAILLKKIGSMIRVAETIPVTPGKPKIVTLVGPTGVGKTTTIAKLATNQKLLNKKKVALISSDTFRIGAVDQLRTFANIAGIPLTVVYSPSDMQAAIKKYRNMEVVYIDTTGRSQSDSKRLSEMQKFIHKANPDETHLVLSVTTRFKNIIDISEKFSIFKYNRIILTKLDETSSLGIILNLADKVKKPFSYLTTGQNVPEDIERAAVEKLARKVVRRKSN